MLREPGKLPRYVTGDHFAAVYGAADTATMPGNLPDVTAGDWWRGLLATAYLTGWRISEILAMRREDLNLQTGTVVMRSQDNKGRRDELVKLHPTVLII
jgi:integrase